ncbi:MAG: ADP-ribosylglycohydrolase family protein, partial [Planctomycetota bacterium]
NALSAELAWRDLHHVGLVLQPPAGSGLEWAGLVAAVIAAACDPEVDFERALEAGLAFVGGAIRAEVERALEIAEHASEPLAMREEFERHYSGRGTVYAMSQANEIVSKAMAVVSATVGCARESILTAVNFGRDTDCLAAVAGGISGALSGARDLPAEWIAQLDAATEANPHTCLKLSVRDQASIVTEALDKERERLDRRATRLGQAL